MNPVQQFLEFLTANSIRHDHTAGGSTDIVKVYDAPDGKGYAEWKFVNTAFEAVNHHSA